MHLSRFSSLPLEISKLLIKIILPARPIYILKVNKSPISIILLTRLIYIFHSALLLEKSKEKLIFTTKITSLLYSTDRESCHHLRQL